MEKRLPVHDNHHSLIYQFLLKPHTQEELLCFKHKDFCAPEKVAHVHSQNTEIFVFQRLLVRLKKSNLEYCVSNTESKISCVCASNTKTDAKANHVSQESHVAIEGNIMAEQGDGLTKSQVIKEKDHSSGHIPNTNVFVFETQKLLFSTFYKSKWFCD